MSYPCFDIGITWGFFSPAFHKWHGSAIYLDADGKEVWVSYVARVPHLEVVRRYFHWEDTVPVGRIYKFVGCVEGKGEKYYKDKVQYIKNCTK